MSIISAGGAVTGSGGPAGPDPRDYFNTVLWTGDGNNPRTISGLPYAPDFVWIKSRSLATSHLLNDTIRGGNATLFSDGTFAETANNGGGYLSAFTSDGFSVTAGGSGDNAVNNTSDTYVAWNWKANGTGVSNTDGTITSTVSANTDSGFSIVTYTGTGSAATVGHGLGVAPSMVVLKNRSSATDWIVGHSNLTSWDYFLKLNTTAAQTDFPVWNDTAPTSTVFSIGTDGSVNSSGEGFVAYCFAAIPDYSAFGSYTGNGSATGPSVTTDFEPTWLLIKRTDSTGDWIIHDSARDASNPRTAFLEPNTADAEGSGLDVDFNSTGFQIKSTSATVNANGGTYIYMCIA